MWQVGCVVVWMCCRLVVSLCGCAAGCLCHIVIVQPLCFLSYNLLCRCCFVIALSWIFLLNFLLCEYDLFICQHVCPLASGENITFQLSSIFLYDYQPDSAMPARRCFWMPNRFFLLPIFPWESKTNLKVKLYSSKEFIDNNNGLRNIFQARIAQHLLMCLLSPR